MSNKFLTYLERDHARLEQLVANEARKLQPSQIELARLKKMKLAVKDQIAAWQHDSRALASA